MLLFTHNKPNAMYMNKYTKSWASLRQVSKSRGTLLADFALSLALVLISFLIIWQYAS